MPGRKINATGSFFVRKKAPNMTAALNKLFSTIPNARLIAH